MKIVQVLGRQILDSRGNPTVEADIWLDNGVFGRAAVPSGASTGKHEAHELRDGGNPFHGMAVTQAANNINDAINKAVVGIPADDQFMLDARMCELDGTPNKESLGANAILAVSLAAAHAAAKSRGILLYSHINDISGNPSKSLPMPMINVLNGGKHADHSTDIQESMIIPISANSFQEAVRMGAEVFTSLKTMLHKQGLSTAVGDEGGFTLPVTKGNREALDVLSSAIEDAGYKVGKDIAFALDVASSELFQDNAYTLSKDKSKFSSNELINWYEQLITDFPIVSIEDGLDQDDWDGWKLMKQRLNIQLVGDDLLVTNIERLRHAIDIQAANAILIKPNQIGTLTETLQAIALAKENGWRTIISHRSGETEDTTIAHIAIGTGAGQIKTGSLSRSERTAKHNEIMRIESIDPTIALANPF